MAEVVTVAAVSGAADSANVANAEGLAAANFQAAGLEVACWEAGSEAAEMAELVTVAAVSGAADSANVSEAEGWAAADFQAAGWEVAGWDARRL